MPESQSETSSELERLCVATRRAINLEAEANKARQRRDEALRDVRDLLGYGDLLATIQNAQRRIGVLMTEEK